MQKYILVFKHKCLFSQKSGFSVADIVGLIISSPCCLFNCVHVYTVKKTYYKIPVLHVSLYFDVTYLFSGKFFFFTKMPILVKKKILERQP